MSFDVNAYRQSVTPVRTDDIDFAAFVDNPLDESVLRCLRYMHDVESHTVCYLRDLLLTKSHDDPRVTTFLTMWAYEEYWHGVAIGQVLAAHGELAEDARIAPMRARLTSWKDRVGPYVGAVGSAVMGEDFVALHMSWGAINEWSTQAGYERLIAKADHPVLTELLGRIAAQESRHIAFYASEARLRLARSARARRVTRWALTKLWAPVGSSVMPPAESEFLLDYLMGDDAGRIAVARIDAHVDRLPGLSGLRLVGSRLDARAAQTGTTSSPAPRVDSPATRSLVRA